MEERFVLHARFARLYTLSPLLTVMMDRLYQRPAFARAAALEPGSRAARAAAIRKP